MARILVGVNDLIFYSKINETAKQLGVEIQPAKGQKEFAELVRNRPGLIIIDLNFKELGPLEVIRKLKNTDGFMNIPILAYCNHTQKDLIQKAEFLGCDFVLSQSEFSGKLPDFVKRFCR